MHELIAVIAAVRHAVQIPGQVVPRLQTGDALTAVGRERPDLTDGRIHPLAERRQRRFSLSGDRGVGLREEPGVAEGAAADHAQVRAGVAQDVRGVRTGEDIAVGDDGDGDGCLDSADDVPVRPARVHLRPRAPVHRDRGGPGGFTDFGEFHRVDAAAVPAFAELDGHGPVRRAAYGLDDAPGQVRITHQGRAVPGPDDLAHGAAHVDVQNVRAGERERHGRRLRHDLRLVTEDLRGGRVLVFGHIEQGLGLLVPVDQRLRADHLRRGQGRALRPAEGAEGKVRHARHRGENHPAGKLYVSDVWHVIFPGVLLLLFRLRRAKSRLQSVFGGALPRQKHPEPSLRGLASTKHGASPVRRAR